MHGRNVSVLSHLLRLHQHVVGKPLPRRTARPTTLTRPFASTRQTLKTAMPPRPTLPDSELHHVYLKGSGPGGQKINKTNSACQLTHLPTGIVVKSQATRSRSQNHNIARRILAEKIELLEKGEGSRVAIKAAVASKKKASKRKKALRKYRKVAEGDTTREQDDAEEGEEREDGEGVEEEESSQRKVQELKGSGGKNLEIHPG